MIHGNVRPGNGYKNGGCSEASVLCFQLPVAVCIIHSRIPAFSACSRDSQSYCDTIECVLPHRSRDSQSYCDTIACVLLHRKGVILVRKVRV